MSEQVPETPVEVTVEVTVPETPEAEPEATPEVVVVEAPAEEVTPVVVETAIDHEGRIAVLESRMDAVEQTATAAKYEAEAAVSIAVAEPEPEVIVEPIPEDPAPVEEDTAPDNEHWWFKKGWF